MVKQNSMKFPMGIPGSICLWESSHWPLVVLHPVTPGSLEIIPELHWWWLESWQMFNNGKVETQCFLVGGWAYPSEKVWFCQLGWWHSQLNGKITFMFQSTKQFFLQSNFIHIIASFLGHHHCDSKWQVILELPYGFPVWRPHRLRNRWVRNRRDSHPLWLSRDTSHCATSVPLCLAWLQQKNSPVRFRECHQEWAASWSSLTPGCWQLIAFLGPFGFGPASGSEGIHSCCALRGEGGVHDCPRKKDVPFPTKIFHAKYVKPWHHVTSQEDDGNPWESMMMSIDFEKWNAKCPPHRSWRTRG